MFRPLRFSWQDKTMVRVSDIANAIESLAPKNLKEDFDNVGLLFGKNEKEVKRVLIALDATEETINEAAKVGADMIVCHHPLIFNPPKSITDSDTLGRSLLALGRADISLYSAHTNLDKAKGGLNDLFIKKLNLTSSENLDGDGAEDGIGRICLCDTTLFEMIKRVKEAFNLPIVRYAGLDRAIGKIAVSTGNGRSLTGECIRKKCDLYITGELHLADTNELLASGVSYIEVPHFDSEIICRELFSDLIKKDFPSLEILFSSEENKIKNFL